MNINQNKKVCEYMLISTLSLKNINDLIYKKVADGFTK